ncbi:MAG: DUF2238 domain-containing protein [Phycisphaerales bacterium JB039]
MAGQGSRSGWDSFRSGGAVVFAVALLGFSGLALQRGNAEFLFYGGVMILLAGAVLALDHKVHLSRAVLLGLLVWAILHLAGGNVAIGEGRVLYNWRPSPGLPRYDQLVHAYGFAVATLLSWECLSSAMAARTHKRTRPTTGIVVAAALMGMGLGALNEVVEFIATITLPQTNVGGYDNTGWDLVSNMTGAAAMAVWIRVSQ